MVSHIPRKENLTKCGKALGERQELQAALISLLPGSKSLKGDLLCCTILGKYFGKRKCSCLFASLSPLKEAAWRNVLAAFSPRAVWEEGHSHRARVLLRGNWAEEGLSLALQILMWYERTRKFLNAQNREDASLWEFWLMNLAEILQQEQSGPPNKTCRKDSPGPGDRREPQWWLRTPSFIEINVSTKQSQSINEIHCGWSREDHMFDSCQPQGHSNPLSPPTPHTLGCFCQENKTKRDKK